MTSREAWLWLAQKLETEYPLIPDIRHYEGLCIYPMIMRDKGMVSAAVAKCMKKQVLVFRPDSPAEHYWWWSRVLVPNAMQHRLQRATACGFLAAMTPQEKGTET